jgi:hypothetical protein
VDGEEYIIKTPIVSLCKTFVGTKQEKIMSPFYINGVKTMSYCFFNCKYSIPNNPIALANPSGNLQFATSWSWRKNFPLIP